MHTPLVTRKRQTRNCETRSPTPGNTRSWECPRAGPLFTVGMWPPGRKGGTAHSTSEGLPKGPSGVCTSHGGQLGHGEGRVGYLVGLWLMWGVSCSLRAVRVASGVWAGREWGIRAAEYSSESGGQGKHVRGQGWVSCRCIVQTHKKGKNTRGEAHV